MNFPACMCKSQNFAQGQPNFAPSHDGEMVTFRNSNSALQIGLRGALGMQS